MSSLERISELSKQITAEHDSEKVLLLIKELRKLLSEEQERLKYLVSKNSAR